jgi:hypothetical protein
LIGGPVRLAVKCKAAPRIIDEERSRLSGAATPFGKGSADLSATCHGTLESTIDQSCGQLTRDPCQLAV